MEVETEKGFCEKAKLTHGLDMGFNVKINLALDVHTHSHMHEHNTHAVHINLVNFMYNKKAFL